MNTIDKAVTETLEDMITNRTYCGCCNTDCDYAELIMRALQRTPVDWWPNAADCFGPTSDEALGKGCNVYAAIYKALVERKL
jgi:hypothetical protein